MYIMEKIKKRKGILGCSLDFLCGLIYNRQVNIIFRKFLKRGLVARVLACDRVDFLIFNLVEEK